MENYMNVSQDIRDQLNAEAEAVQIILTRIDNDIYSTVDACPNACEMWKAIERLKQGESINVQDFQTNLYWEFGNSHHMMVNHFNVLITVLQMMNEASQTQCHVTIHQVMSSSYFHYNQECKGYHIKNLPTQKHINLSSTKSQQSTRNRGKAIVTSSAPTYDPEPATVTEDEEMSKEKEIDKLMALISLSFKKSTKPTNKNLRTSSKHTSRVIKINSPRIQQRNWCYNCKEYGHVSRECQKPKRGKGCHTYHKEKMLLCKQEEAGVQLNAEQADWKDDTDDESEELEAHYMYMAQI
ncbi:reverse transcriptase domain-containing protein [Tanacetum coccineum]